MSTKLVSIFIVLVGLSVPSLVRGTIPNEVLPTEKFELSEVLDSQGNYFLFWNFNNSHVTFEVHVRTRGWVGFGLSDNGNMYPSDVIIGWVDDAGQTHFSDRHATGHRKPIKDTHQDWHLLHGGEYEFGTVLKFQREIDTCDPDDKVIPENTVRLIYAYHDVDPISDEVINYHGTTRGTKSVSLLSTINISPDLPNDVKYFDFLNHNFQMPAVKTFYQCTGFKMPAIGKHHMVKFEPVITPGNELHVHHIILSRCNVPDPDQADGASGHCYNNRPALIPYCDNTVLAWAIGGEPFSFPDTVGFPVGGAEDPVFYVMETHYDNPTQRSGVIDNSGIRLTLTSTLRPMDADVMMLGDTVSFSQMVPPNRQNFVTTGICHQDCLNEGFKEANLTEINIFANLQHSHLIGREIRTRHFRNGTEIDPIMNDPNYDFDFQETRVLPREIKLLPGDSMSVDCVYDSTGRSGVTFGGLSTQDEMCLSFVYYYPRFPVSYCISRRTYDAFGTTQEDTYRQFAAIDWTNQTEVSYYENKIAQSTIAQFCTLAGLRVKPVPNIDPAIYQSPFVPNQPKCTHRK